MNGALNSKQVVVLLASLCGARWRVASKDKRRRAVHAAPSIGELKQRYVGVLSRERERERERKREREGEGEERLRRIYEERSDQEERGDSLLDMR